MWEDSESRERVSTVQCMDISPSGAKFRLFEKIPSRASVLFNCPALGIAGRGTVRYCLHKKAAYEIGLECLGGTGWRGLVGRLRAERAPDQPNQAG